MPVVSLEDLVRIKRTQRDKDWLMLRRLVEADVERHGWRGTRDRIRFWLRAGATTLLLLELARRFPRDAGQVARRRPAVRAALRGSRSGVERALQKEERAERAKDRQYWAPLRRELERWRLGRQAGRVPPHA